MGSRAKPSAVPIPFSSECRATWRTEMRSALPGATTTFLTNPIASIAIGYRLPSASGANFA
jgi:hypothetical protein